MRTHNSSLRQWRTSRKLTQDQAADYLGLSLWRLHRLETGKQKRVDLSVALHIEDKTGVSPRALLPLHTNRPG